jgi:NAD(P)-dependent dehydrogenase (short-subunit alcohol dehydrogenase family)
MQTENRSQKIAVTGATGRVGSHLAEILAREDTMSYRSRAQRVSTWSPEGGSGADRVRAAAASTLEAAQDELTMVTTEPWPLRGRGELPTPHADFTAAGDTVRLFYGDPAAPVLELEPLRVIDILSDAGP